MTDAMTLFDPDIYGPGRKPKTKPARVSSAVEPHVEPWAQIRHRNGLWPYFHLISVLGAVGNVVALCGSQGTKVHNDGVTVMVRCPTCAAAQDILRP